STRGGALADQLPDPRRRQRKVAGRYPERAEGCGNRVGDDAADRNDAALARALGAERIVWRGAFLERDRSDVGKIARRGHEIIRERSREELLQESAAEALHDGAYDLAVQRQRVDDAAGVLDRDIVEELDAAGLGIDRDVGCVRAVTVGALVAGVGALRRDSGEASQRQRLLARAVHRAGV